MAQKIFIDCGFHHGEGLKHFSKLLGINDDWVVLVFEPNPECNAHERVRAIANGKYSYWCYSDAVWIHSNHVEFRQENHFETASGSPTDGKSLLDGWSSHIADLQPVQWSTKPIYVRAIDFSYFVYIHNHKDVDIYCKMDIEGAEFAVLRKMLADDTVKYIKHLWVEFHENLVPGESLKTKAELIKQLSQHTTVTQWH